MHRVRSAKPIKPCGRIEVSKSLRTSRENEERMRWNLPTGTITLLFADIEGSTRLVERLGEEGYVGLLADCRSLLRSTLGASGGQILTSTVSASAWT
jgi:class 3 adenylate cyclase